MFNPYQDMDVQSENMKSIIAIDKPKSVTFEKVRKSADTGNTSI